MSRHDLTVFERQVIEPLLPNKPQAAHHRCAACEPKTWRELRDNL